jgi:hypothetical protein
MSKAEEEQNEQHSGRASLNRFLPGGEFGSIADRRQYEQRLSSLPPEQREFAEESTHFADLWQYFSEQRMELPKDVVKQVGGLSKLPAAEQIVVLRHVNQALMEYLDDVGEDSGVRH